MLTSDSFASRAFNKTTRLKETNPETALKKEIPFWLKPFATIKPAVLALYLQCMSLVIVIAVSMLLNWQWQITSPIGGLVTLQASLALLFTWAFQMRTWWRYIQFCFPIALFLMSGVNLSSHVYLFGFILTLTWYWSTYKTQVPFYPSLPRVWREIEQLLPKNRSCKVIDIGSGIGDLAMYLAKARPDSSFAGIEIAPLPWLLSRCRAYLKRSQVNFQRGDYETLNFAEFDVVIAYLSPAAMPALWQKASQEMKQGSMLISLEFSIPDISPSKILTIKNSREHLYIWLF